MPWYIEVKQYLLFMHSTPKLSLTVWEIELLTYILTVSYQTQISNKQIIFITLYYLTLPSNKQIILI